MTGNGTPNAIRSMCIALLVLSVFQVGCRRNRTSKVRLGVIAECSGAIPAVGASCRNGAELAVEEINAAGGILMEGGYQPIELQVEDSGGKPEQAAAVAQKLVTNQDVLAILGPNASSNALPAGEIAERAGVVLISPWSTNPRTTLNARTGLPKQYVFRACMTDAFEAKALGDFARKGLGGLRAAVLFDVGADVFKSQAEQFKAVFEARGGKIVAYESYTTGDKDFSAQLTKIQRASPDLVFLPSYYTDVPLEMKQARQLGITAPFLGSDGWSTEDLITMCGEACEGAYLVNHYTPGRANHLTEGFTAAYRARYGRTPDDVAALSYDAMNLLAKALASAGRRDRRAVRDALARIQGHEGVTGNISYPGGSGDPVKGAVILQIRNGAFHWYSDALP